MAKPVLGTLAIDGSSITPAGTGGGRACEETGGKANLRSAGLATGALAIGGSSITPACTGGGSEANLATGAIDFFAACFGFLSLAAGFAFDAGA